VDYSLKSLRHGRLVCIPGWQYRTLVRVTRVIPRTLLRWIIRKNADKINVATRR